MTSNEHPATATEGPLRVEPRKRRAGTHCYDDGARKSNDGYCRNEASGTDGLCTFHARRAAERKKRIFERQIADAGFDLRYVEFCEDATTPGIIGYYAGVTSHRRKEVKVSTRKTTGHGIKDRTIFEIVEILRHEMRHVAEPDWKCGNQPIR